MPEAVQDTFGYALYLAQTGRKPLKGFGSAGVLEIVESEDNGTYRAVYTVKLGNSVYVCTVSRRNRRAASRHRSRAAIWSANA